MSNRKTSVISIAISLMFTATLFAQSGEEYRAQPPAHKGPTKAAADVAGSGTTGALTKWSDGASGTLADSVLFESNGKLGLGTTNPLILFHLYGLATTDVFEGMGPDPKNGPAMNYGYAGSTFGRGAGFFNVRPDASATAPNPSLRFMTQNIQRMIITKDGAVGIGSSATNYNPAYTFEVLGTAHISGDVTVDGNLAALYQDVAEWVPTNGKLPEGTVVVINDGKTNEVTPSQKAYDTRVAGVVSQQPGLSLGKKSDDKSQVATVGRVKVRVDATKAPINVGDLLVSSDTPGMAMKSQPVNLSGIEIHRPGTILGKALEPLASGKGEILVLLSLQ